MNVSTYDEVVIEDSKITGYLLNINHAEGGTKAQYFRQHGFDIEKPEAFRQILLEHLGQHSPTLKETKFGTKYIFSGTIRSPGGNEFMLRSIWMKSAKENILKFVTAYPI